MNFLNFFSYAEHKGVSASSISRLSSLLILEGIGILIWLVSEPSEPQSRIFLFYSLARWGLILADLGFVFLVSFFLGGIKKKRKGFEDLLTYLNKEKYVGLFSSVLIVLFLFIVGLTFWASHQNKFEAYYMELRPLLLLAVISISQILLFYIINTFQTLSKIWQKYIPADAPAQIHAIASQKVLFILIGISIFYLLLQIYAYLEVQEAAHLGDTTSYLEGAKLSLNNPAFFRERRPWGIALAFKILGVSLKSIDLAQVLTSTLAWLFLAWVFSHSFKKTRGKIIAFLTILGFSLSPAVQVWNHAALSESFTISSTVIILTLLIALVQKWEKKFYLWLFPLIVIWMSLHEINLYIGLLVAIAFFITGIFQKKFRFLWILSLLIGVVFIINAKLSAAYALPRWGLPLAEVITKRILPDQEFREYFAEHGMPLSPKLMAFSGEWANTKDYAIINSLALKPFSVWLFTYGKSVYTKFLVTHPIYTITAPLAHLKVLLAFDFENFISQYTHPLPKIINGFFYPIRLFWVYLGSSFLVAILSIKKIFTAKKRVFWVVFIFWLISIPYLYLTWHGDAHSVPRHAIIANIQFHLGIWLLLLLNINETDKE